MKVTNFQFTAVNNQTQLPNALLKILHCNKPWRQPSRVRCLLLTTVLHFSVKNINRMAVTELWAYVLHPCVVSASEQNNRKIKPSIFYVYNIKLPIYSWFCKYAGFQICCLLGRKRNRLFSKCCNKIFKASSHFIIFGLQSANKKIPKQTGWKGWINEACTNAGWFWGESTTKSNTSMHILPMSAVVMIAACLLVKQAHHCKACPT